MALNDMRNESVKILYVNIWELLNLFLFHYTENVFELSQNKVFIIFISKNIYF